MLGSAPKPSPKQTRVLLAGKVAASTDFQRNVWVLFVRASALGLVRLGQ